MDFQYWLYIIIGIIYLISQFRKKPEQKQDDSQDYRPERPERRFEAPASKPAPQRQLTFEELLREITEGKVATEPKPVSPYSTVDEVDDEAEDLEDVEYDYRKKDKIYDDYEAAKTQAFYRPSLEETMSLETTDMRFGKFKEFELDEKNPLLDKYLADLKDPEGLKKAVVMSEVLQRKF